ncbi:MAG: MBL fold metallo-hydrolase, partial [Rhodanobacteraceae bacterium]
MTPSVRGFHHADTGTWTYVVAADPNSAGAVIIDPVLDFDAASGRVRSASAQGVAAHLAGHGLAPNWILETHAHADHLSAAQWLKRKTGARVGIGRGIVEVQRRFKPLLGLDDTFSTDGSQFDHLFADDETVRIGEIDVRVIDTPGHTPDGVSYLIGDAVFIGDTLFAPSAGSARCDFPG